MLERRDGSPTQSVYVYVGRSLIFTLLGLSVLVLYVAVHVTGLAGSMRTVVSRMGSQPVEFETPLTLRSNGMTVTRYKPDPKNPNGPPACWSLTQNEGESEDAFIKRAAKSYAAWCAWIEGS